MSLQGIQQEVQMFQSSVMKLSGSIGQAAVLWRDQKYSDLSSSVSQVASQAKDVIVSGERCCSSVSAFQKIAAEEC